MEPTTPLAEIIPGYAEVDTDDADAIIDADVVVDDLNLIFVNFYFFSFFTSFLPTVITAKYLALVSLSGLLQLLIINLIDGAEDGLTRAVHFTSHSISLSLCTSLSPSLSLFSPLCLSTSFSLSLYLSLFLCTYHSLSLMHTLALFSFKIDFFSENSIFNTLSLLHRSNKLPKKTFWAYFPRDSFRLSFFSPRAFHHGSVWIENLAQKAQLAIASTMVSILASGPSCPRLKLPAFPKFQRKKLSIFLRLINRAAKRKVDSGLKMLIEPI